VTYARHVSDEFVEALVHLLVDFVLELRGQPAATTYCADAQLTRTELNAIGSLITSK
jgi:hypothetical protein